jgi:hypothetical protein
MDYNYKTCDFKTENIEYSYSDFFGLDFIESYYRYRSSFVIESDLDIDIKELLKSIEPKSQMNMKEMVSLNSFLGECLNNDFSQKKQSFDLLLRRFEVTKKIYAEYNLDFRPTDRARRELFLENYIFFSYTLAEAYNINGSLKYLNSMLKVNDIICSMYWDLDSKERAIFSNLIRKELSCILNLFKDLESK